DLLVPVEALFLPVAPVVAVPDEPLKFSDSPIPEVPLAALVLPVPEVPVLRVVDPVEGVCPAGIFPGSSLLDEPFAFPDPVDPPFSLRVSIVSILNLVNN